MAGAPDETWISDVVEDAAGNLWAVETTQPWGPSYLDGMVVYLDGTTGAVLRGGVRGFSDSGENRINGGSLSFLGLEVVGSVYVGTSSQQPAFGVIDLATGDRVGSRWMGTQLDDPGEFELLVGSS